jgi:hypothetical protein
MVVKFANAQLVYDEPKLLYKIIYLIPIDKANENIFKAKAGELKAKCIPVDYKINNTQSKTTVNSDESNRLKCSYTSFESEKSVGQTWTLQLIGFTAIIVFSRICIT